MSQPKPLIPPHIFWPGLVIGLLLLCITGMVYAITIAFTRSANGAAVEPRYYQKSTAWDKSLAAQQNAESSGLILHSKITGNQDNPLLAITIQRDSQPVTDLELKIEAFPNVKSRQRSHFDNITYDEKNQCYLAPLTNYLPGIWTVRVELSHNNAPCYFEMVYDMTISSPSP